MISRRQFTAICVGSAALPTAGFTQSVSMHDAHRALVFGQEVEYLAALKAISDRGNQDMIPGLILGLRFTRMSVSPLIEVLRQLTGDTKIGKWSRWNDWMLWQEAHPEVIPHESYTDFKREMYQTIDPNFDVFLKPKYFRQDRMKIRMEEVTWGGVRKDGIPSLDKPELVSATDTKADYMLDDDLVFGVSINGDTRAYPLRVMGWHEMFNAVIGGVPVALAYCTLCGSGILFETNVAGRSEPFVFGSSGFLYRSNKLMFDRQTDSLWNQFTGKPVSGELVNSGIELKQRPVVITTWADWKSSNPDTTIVTLNTGFDRDYRTGIVYSDYFASGELMFPTIVDQSRHRQKDYVFGVRAFGGAKAWPLKVFIDNPVINDAVAGKELVLIGDPKKRAVRAYARKGQKFSRSAGGELVTDGITWEMTEAALISETGERLPRVAGHIAYWFAWNGYLADVSEVYEG